MAQMSETGEPLSERVMVPVTKTMLAAISDYRFKHRCETRSEALRKMIETALEVEKKSK